MSKGWKHKEFVEGDDMTREEIIGSISSKMAEYIKDDPTCKIEFEMTDDEPVKGKLHPGNHRFEPGLVTVTPSKIILTFRPDVIRKFGSMQGDYLISGSNLDMIENGVVGMIDMATKRAFRRWQYYRFMKTFGFNPYLAMSYSLDDDEKQYALGKVGNITYECAKVVMEDITKKVSNNYGNAILRTNNRTVTEKRSRKASSSEL